jgi:hypothetical protein
MDIRAALTELCDAFNAHDLDRIMAGFADDCTLEMPRGSEPYPGAVRGLRPSATDRPAAPGSVRSGRKRPYGLHTRSIRSPYRESFDVSVFCEILPQTGGFVWKRPDKRRRSVAGPLVSARLEALLLRL